jgi:FkbM family methyltransferase
LRGHYQRLTEAGKAPVILDLGANIGAASIYFAATWPAARIVAVEPATDNFELLADNTAPFANIPIVHAAVASRDGHAAIVDSRAEKWAYRTEISEAGGIKAVSVPSLLASIETAAPFIAKIDIEGAEAELFSAAADWAGQFALLIIELHDWMLPRSGSSSNFQKVHAGLDRDLILGGENLYSLSNRI